VRSAVRMSFHYENVQCRELVKIDRLCNLHWAEHWESQAPMANMYIAMSWY
jgi:hypothetical protein